MSYVAHIYRVLIASPGDAAKARDAVERGIHHWNAQHGRSQKAHFQPWRWEIDAVPLAGEHPQDVLNAQGVDQSDVVFAVFDARLGSPTQGEVSGTVEEIRRAIASDVRVHIYFSITDLPRTFDVDQFTKLRDFKQQMSGTALYGEYGSEEELSGMVQRDLSSDIASLHVAPSHADSFTGDQRFLVQLQREKELSGFSSSGRPRHTTRMWVEVVNRGSDDAVISSIESIGTNGFHLLEPSTASTIHAGQTRRVSAIRTGGGGDDPVVVRITWDDDAGNHEKDFHIDW